MSILYRDVMPLQHKKGFTLIELLVVISIISFLASIITVAVSSSREKARDTVKKAEVRSVETALTGYVIDTGTVPPNYGGATVAFDNDPPCSGCDGKNAYQKSMEVLVETGYLPEVPISQGPEPYGYYAYGTTALFGTELENPSSNSSSCLPFYTEDDQICMDQESGPPICVDTGDAVEGDANGDGKVDIVDQGIVAAAWQSSAGPPASANWDPRADFNDDGHVDIADQGILATNWQHEGGVNLDNWCTENEEFEDYCTCVSP